MIAGSRRRNDGRAVTSHTRRNLMGRCRNSDFMRGIQMKKMFLILVMSWALGSFAAAGQIVTLSATDKKKVEANTAAATADHKNESTGQATCADEPGTKAWIAGQAQEWQKSVHNQ